MAAAKALIFDLGGVLATNYSPQLWEEFAREYGLPVEALMAFRREIRAELWTGEISEPQFWDRLTERFPAISGAAGRERLLAHIRPLPALERLADWSAEAELHLLSNHRAEWIAPVLAPVRHLFASQIVSGEVGCRKPDPAIFRLMAKRLGGGKRVLYVDDMEANLAEGRSLGWHTLLADEAGAWIERAEAWLAAE